MEKNGAGWLAVQVAFFREHFYNIVNALSTHTPKEFLKEGGWRWIVGPEIIINPKGTVELPWEKSFKTAKEEAWKETLENPGLWRQ